MRVGLLILATLFTLSFTRESFAVTVSIFNTPSEVTNEAFEFDVSVTGAQAGTNYLRANLFTPGTTKYFGFTYNGTNFINSSDFSQYLPITIDQTGAWTGKVKTKLDSDSSYFSGPATYSLKVRRYTQSGSSYTWSNETSLLVSYSNPTPTPTPTPTTTPVLTPTPTPNQTTTPTNTTKPKATPSPSANKTSTPQPSPTKSSMPSPETTSTIVKTKNIPSSSSPDKQATVAAATSTPSPSIAIKNQKQFNPLLTIGIFLVFVGFASLGYIYLKAK